MSSEPPVSVGIQTNLRAKFIWKKSNVIYQLSYVCLRLTEAGECSIALKNSCPDRW